MAGCAGQSGPALVAAKAAAQKTIVIGATRLDPGNLTITASDAIGFISTAGDPLQVQFIQPTDQAGKITCRVTDPKQLERGEAPWAEFHTSSEGRLTAYVPPGPLPSTYSFAPGSYSYYRQGGRRADAPHRGEARAARHDHREVGSPEVEGGEDVCRLRGARRRRCQAPAPLDALQMRAVGAGAVSARATGCERVPVSCPSILEPAPLP